MSSPRLAASSSLAESGDEGSDPGINTDASDDEMDWEEIQVQVPHGRQNQELADYEEFHAQNEAGPSGVGPSKKEIAPISETKDIEIIITGRKTVDDARKKQAQLSAERRAMRLQCHKIHTIALLANALVRNRWINDQLLHARLLSLTPIALQTAFTTITKTRYPDAIKRGRLFETALMRLTQWWYEDFFEIRDYGHIRSRTFDEVQKELQEGTEPDDDGEVIRGEKSLMKHALMRKGSRDVSAQLFTALCRALDLPTRLVVSLQSVPWQASVGKPKTSTKKRSGKGKEKASVPEAELEDDVREEGSDDSGPEDDDMEEVSIPSKVDVKGKGKAAFPGEGQTLNGSSSSSAKGKGKALSKPVIRLRKARRGKKLGRKSTPPPPIGGFPPVFWTEVFSRPDGRWMPADATRNITNKRKVFEPPPHDRDNRMVYVIAVEEDGYARDVTARYARDYGSKTSKAQLGGKGRQLWWEYIMSLVARPYRLQRDDVEDEEFEFNKITEAMPTSINGFKNHPVYMLEQHLKREEVIFPRKEIGKFRGESVFPRSNVIPLKTAENWMRIGRSVKEGAQPMKWVKQRAATLNKRRAIEAAQREGEETLQGLYSQTQTELYVSEPVVDGKVPKNDFGNIDLYTPSMLPAGASHIPYKGAAKVAKKLGFDYAEAVTNFQFKKGRAIPVIEGIVIAEENEETMLEAYWESERDAAEKEEAKKRERVLKRWMKLVNGLRIYYRLKDQYAKPTNTFGTGVVEVSHQEQPSADEALPGGFLAEADTIVQPFHLPKYQHNVYEPSSSVGSGASRIGPGPDAGTVVERSEVSDKLSLGPFGASQLDHISALTLSSTNPGYHVNSTMHTGEQGDAGMDSDSGNDMEEVFPGVSQSNLTVGEERGNARIDLASGSGTGASTPGGMPKSLLELAKARSREAPKGEPEIAGTVERPAQEVDMDDIPTKRRSNGRATRSKAAPARRKKNAPRTSLRKVGKRKRDISPEVASPISSDLDEDYTENEDKDEEVDGDLSIRLRQTRAKAKPTAVGKRRAPKPSRAPAPSTRVLRTRAPKSPEKQRAEEEAEAELREAIYESS